MKHEVKYIGQLKIGDKFSFPKDYNKRIVSTILSKRGYITNYIRLGKGMKSFRYYKEVFLISEAERN